MIILGIDAATRTGFCLGPLSAHGARVPSG